ncbi:hypothetical protein DK847_10460 [Aestuariivirga litoralis]|uniref:CBS domain-containing protein n=1 Tax=Aestuariivirga litoralis TaxID=2650924 RepID=A0A2W2BKW8_9HYPH|nr:CBS domain-containing protein [Aestuariivirga litoralis]PZF76879.1 hypothetical protein DK847_10460 [Aestuariivirga litoralis]
MTVARILEKKGYRVFSIAETAPLGEIIGALAAHKIGVLIVTDASGNGVGIVSERDVIRALDESFEATRTAADIMTRTLVRCSVDDTEGNLMEQMGKARVRHLPVQHNGKLVGVVSARDILNLRIEKLNELMQEILAEAAARS